MKAGCRQQSFRQSFSKHYAKLEEVRVSLGFLSFFEPSTIKFAGATSSNSAVLIKSVKQGYPRLLHQPFTVVKARPNLSASQVCVCPCSLRTVLIRFKFVYSAILQCLFTIKVVEASNIQYILVQNIYENSLKKEYGQTLMNAKNRHCEMRKIPYFTA